MKPNCPNSFYRQSTQASVIATPGRWPRCSDTSRPEIRSTRRSVHFRFDVLADMLDIGENELTDVLDDAVSA